MKVYFVRHGDYASSDIRKPLNHQGIADINKMAIYLKKRGDVCDEIWHSPKVRAVESAQIFSEVLDCSAVIEKDYLKPNDHPDNVINDLSNVEKNVIIVSHLPFIPKTLMKLFPQEMSMSFAFPTSAVAVVEYVDGAWRFNELLTPETVE